MLVIVKFKKTVLMQSHYQDNWFLYAPHPPWQWHQF